MRKKALEIIVALSIAAGLVLLSWGIMKICYKPTPVQVDQVLKDAEKIRQQRMFMYRDKEGNWRQFQKRVEKSWIAGKECENER